MNYYKYIIITLISLLSANNKIFKYEGNLPSNVNYENIKKSNLIPICPYDIGYLCNTSEDCSNNYVKITRDSYCMPTSGDYFPDFKGIDQVKEIIDIYDLVHSEEIYIITILYEDKFKDNTTYDTVDEWYRNCPYEKIPILADNNKYLHTWL